MKTTLSIIMLLVGALSLKAQHKTASNQEKTDTTVYSSVEVIPEFTGGINEFYKFLGRNINYPATAREKNTQGKVILKFIVEKDGSLGDIQIIKSVSKEIDNEAIRVISISPKWNPGKQNGVPVRCSYVVPISFSLAKG